MVAKETALAAESVAETLAAERRGFYVGTLHRLLEEGLLRRNMSVLVVCGGQADREAFLELGFDDVTISNLGGGSDEGVQPYRWSAQDAEDLSYDDESFDLVVVSAGLHHCRSPHRGLLEMYRVAREAVFVLESRDSLLMRVAVRLGFVDAYEVTAVAAHDCRAGGVRDTSTPNFVYRWTEREVRKTIASYAPHARHEIRFFHQLELPLSVLALRYGRWGTLAARVLQPVLHVVATAFPSQANLLALLVRKPELPSDLQPWMRVEGGAAVLNEQWIRAHTSAAAEGGRDG